LLILAIKFAGDFEFDMCNERRDLRRDSASSIRVPVRFDTVWAIKRRSPQRRAGAQASR
jgi:hypothetical protein